MLHQTVSELIVNLKNMGDPISLSLVSEIETASKLYCCPNCKIKNSNPYIGLMGNSIVFYCPDCNCSMGFQMQLFDKELIGLKKITKFKTMDSDEDCGGLKFL